VKGHITIHVVVVVDDVVYIVDGIVD